MQSLNVWFLGKDQVDVRREPVPEPGPGDVLLQASRTLISTGTEGICLSRLFAPGTHWDNWVRYPFAPGYSFCGTVAAVGPGVEGFAVGDRVAARAPHRQFVAVPAGSVTRVPDAVSDEDATWFGLGHIVQTGVRRAEHVLGDAVAIVGLGLLGQLVVQYVRLLGARDVIAIDTAPKRLELAKGHGATTTIAAPVGEARDAVLRLTDGNGVDVVYDVTGNAAVFGPALGLARRFGKLLLLGDTGTPGEQCLTSDVIVRGIRIIGAHDVHPPAEGTDLLPWGRREIARLFFTYVARGDMRVSDLVTHRYAPADAPEAYRMLREERATAMGVVFDWSQV